MSVENYSDSHEVEKAGIAERMVKFFRLKVDSVLRGATELATPGLILGGAAIAASSPALVTAGFVLAGVGACMGLYGGYKHQKRVNNIYKRG